MVHSRFSPFQQIMMLKTCRFSLFLMLPSILSTENGSTLQVCSLEVSKTLLCYMVCPGLLESHVFLSRRVPQLRFWHLGWPYTRGSPSSKLCAAIEKNKCPFFWRSTKRICLFFCLPNRIGGQINHTRGEVYTIV